MEYKVTNYSTTKERSPKLPQTPKSSGHPQEVFPPLASSGMCLFSKNMATYQGEACSQLHHLSDLSATTPTMSVKYIHHVLLQHNSRIPKKYVDEQNPSLLFQKDLALGLCFFHPKVNMGKPSELT